MAARKPIVYVATSASDLQQIQAADDLTMDGGLTVNEAGADRDTRIEGDTATSLFVCDAGLDAVQIGTTVAGALADFRQSAIVLNEAGLALTLRVETSARPFAFEVTGAGVRVGTSASGVIADLLSSGVVFNESGADQDFRVEGDTATNCLLVDAGLDAVQIGTTVAGDIADFRATSIVLNEAGADSDFRVEGDTLTHLIYTDASAATENIAFLASAAPNWQSMDGGIFIGNATTAPTGNPASGVFLWAEGGELKARDGGGTVTTLTDAAAGGSGVDGGGLTIRYTFNSSIAGGDPGAGKLALNSGTQSAASTIYVDDLDVNNEDWSAALADINVGTSTTKGQLRILNVADQTKWLLFNVTAFTLQTGYKEFAITIVDASDVAPFANGDLLAFCFTPKGDKGDTGASGGLTITSTKTANYTAVSGEHVICDTNAAAGNFTVTLPATPSAGHTVRVTLITDHATRVVDIAGNGSNINGGTSVGNLRLCLEGDTVLFTYLGGDCGWQAEDRYRPHSAEMVRAASQSISFDTRVGNQINFDTTSFDTGGLADLTNNWMLTRRTGKYLLTAYFGRIGTIDANQRLIVWLRKFTGVSGSDTDLRWVNFLLSPTNAQSIIVVLSVTADLAAGDKIDMVVEQTDSNPMNTETDIKFRPTLIMTELR